MRIILKKNMFRRAFRSLEHVAPNLPRAGGAGVLAMLRCIG